MLNKKEFKPIVSPTQISRDNFLDWISDNKENLEYPFEVLWCLIRLGYLPVKSVDMNKLLDLIRKLGDVLSALISTKLLR